MLLIGLQVHPSVDSFTFTGTLLMLALWYPLPSSWITGLPSMNSLISTTNVLLDCSRIALGRVPGWLLYFGALVPIPIDVLRCIYRFQKYPVEVSGALWDASTRWIQKYPSEKGGVHWNDSSCCIQKYPFEMGGLPWSLHQEKWNLSYHYHCHLYFSHACSCAWAYMLRLTSTRYKERNDKIAVTYVEENTWKTPKTTTDGSC